MNQKKHLNAEAALAASKDAEPGSLWSGDYCENVNCGKCYANPPEVLAGCCGVRAVSEVRAALQSGIDAYHKRKAEKAERREEEVAIAEVNAKINAPAILAVTKDEDGYWLRVDGVKNKALIRLESSSKIVNAALEEVAEKNPDPAPLIPDPPDTPEVRAIMERLARLAYDEGCPIVLRCDNCPLMDRKDICNSGKKAIIARNAFALSWLSRHPAVWPMTIDGPRQFADEARRQGWKR